MMALVLGGLGAGLLGCGSNVTPGGGCVTNQNCPVGEQCVGGSCVPAAQPGCLNDDACGIGEYCDPVDATCKQMQIVGCASDVECPPNQRCNTLTGVCIDGNRNCTDESMCSSIGKHCDTSVQQCVDCIDNSHCPSPQECVANKCVDPGQSMCTMDAQCAPPNTVCEGMRCVPGCNVPGSPITCGLGMSCNAQSGRCESGMTMCMGDAECNPPASICESGSCIAGCTQIGGLQCTGGNVCNQTTGRCDPPSGCVNDTECGAPAGICEGNMCAPGCAQTGAAPCAAGTVCDSVSTGRCVALPGMCTNDSECGPPASVCEGMRCLGGCTEIGGIQCNGNTICNQATGRCDPGGMVCMGDTDCSPPSTVCNLQTGACDPGCLTTGCTAPEVCNMTLGRCEDPGPQPGTNPLNSPCTANNDCASNVCFDIDGVGQRCVESCSNSAQCPSSFTCYNLSGASMCISAQLFNGGATFTQPVGSSCSNGGQCQSNFCPNQTVCTETCSADADCGGGACAWREVNTNTFQSFCDGPIGAGGNGASCSDNNQCRGGVCYGQGTCGALCRSTADCPANNSCQMINYSVCTIDVLGICFGWAINFVKACVSGGAGSVPIGGACSDANVCRDGLCNTQIGQCTGVCSQNSDCPGTHTCSVVDFGDLDGDEIYANICTPN